MNKIFIKLIAFIILLTLFISCRTSGLSTSFLPMKLQKKNNEKPSENLTQQKNLENLHLKTISNNSLTVESYEEWIQKDTPNPRQLAYSNIIKNISNNNEINNLNIADYNSIIEEDNTSLKTLGIDELTNNTNIKYRRSSLYTLMLSDTTYQYYYPIREAFGKTKLPEKFNDHNLGPYQIQLKIERDLGPKRKKKSLLGAYFTGGLIPLLYADRANRRKVALKKIKDNDLSEDIERYLNKNQVAKHLVARWFNRNSKGSFNMDLIAKRGEYNASELDIKIALHSIRGKALLKDAGEELIKNTFVIIYDFQTGVSLEAGGLGFAKRDTYFFKVKSYLYRLVWNDETATKFYTNFWMDENEINLDRKKAFDNSDAFKMKYVGSTIVLDEQKIPYNSNIEQTMGKMIDISIAELQRNYEEFRIKFPLYSGDPIAAKVGKKEGIKQGDKFEVLEQIMNDDGTTQYHKLGTIKVEKPEDVWDNTIIDTPSDSTSKKETLFTGKNGKYHSGMLIRQVN